MKCKLLKGNGNLIQDPNMAQYLENMNHVECEGDNCKFIDQCWNKVKDNVDLIEEKQYE